MKNNLIQIEINIIDYKIGIIRIGDVDYISLIDLSRYDDAVKIYMFLN